MIPTIFLLIVAFSFLMGMVRSADDTPTSEDEDFASGIGDDICGNCESYDWTQSVCQKDGVSRHFTCSACPLHKRREYGKDKEGK